MTQKTSYSKQDMLDCGEGLLFGLDTAKLPRGNMRMVDRITSITADDGTFGKGKVIAEYDINPELWFFDEHFLGDPVMPGCLGLDALWQLVGFFLGWRGNKGKGRALGAGEIKFFGQVLSSAKIVRYELDISRLIERRLIMAIADGRVFVDDREIYTAKDLKVGMFKSTDEF